MTGKTKGGQFEHLDSGQRSVIRRTIARGGDAQIAPLARQYGVKVETILRLLGRDVEGTPAP